MASTVANITFVLLRGATVSELESLSDSVTKALGVPGGYK